MTEKPASWADKLSAALDELSPASSASASPASSASSAPSGEGDRNPLEVLAAPPDRGDEVPTDGPADLPADEPAEDDTGELALPAASSDVPGASDDDDTGEIVLPAAATASVAEQPALAALAAPHDHVLPAPDRPRGLERWRRSAPLALLLGVLLVAVAGAEGFLAWRYHRDHQPRGTVALGVLAALFAVQAVVWLTASVHNRTPA